MGDYIVPAIIVAIWLIDFYWWVIFIAAVFSWLFALGIVDTRNYTVRSIAGFLYRITEPVLQPIQRVIPNFGGIDISPIILLAILWFVELELETLRVHLG